MFLLVIKNGSGDWEIKKVISNPINFRSEITGITYGDISKLDLETRKMEGFWKQEDVYEGAGEYKVFSHKEVVYDDEQCTVTNIYHYVLMPIADIRNDFKQRILSERENKYFFDGFKSVNDAMFPSDEVTRRNFTLWATADLGTQTISVEDISGVTIVLSMAEFKTVYNDLAKFTQQLYIQWREINARIDQANTLDEIITAATW